MRSRIGTALLIVGLVGMAAPARAESPKEHAAKLMKKLATDKKPEQRAAAAKELGDMGAWDAVPALAAALKDPSADVRAGAAYALVKLKDKAKDAAPALKEALADRDFFVRYNAVVALSNMDAATPAELAAPIRSLLDGSDEKDRARAAKWLVRLGFEDPTARKTILDTLEQGAPEVRLLIMKEMWDQKTMQQKGPWKAEVIAHLTPMVTKDRDPKIRYQAIDRLREAKAVSAPVGEALLKAVDDADPDVAQEAARALGDIYDTRRDPLPNTAIAHLAQKLKSTDAEQRVSAAHALGGFSDGYSRTKVTPVVTTALLNDKEPAVRLAALGALFELDYDVPSLLKALKTDADPKIKAAICTQWSKAHDLKFLLANHLAEAVPTLEAARGDANTGVKAACEAALTALRK